MKIMSSRQVFIEQTNERTDGRRFAFTGLLSEPKTSYLVTLSKKVGGGQDQITISGPLEIVTSLEGGRGQRISVTISIATLGGILRTEWS